MATVYEIKVKTVSPWVSYPEEHVEKIFKKFLKEYRNEQGMKFESTEIEVKIKA